jgi:hypothetical protein
VGDGILDHEGADLLGMGDGEPKAHGSAIVLHVKDIAPQTERLGEIPNYGRDMVEGVDKLLCTRRVAVSESGVVRRDKMVLRREL